MFMYIWDFEFGDFEDFLHTNEIIRLITGLLALNSYFIMPWVLAWFAQDLGYYFSFFIIAVFLLFIVGLCRPYVYIPTIAIVYCFYWIFTIYFIIGVANFMEHLTQFFSTIINNVTAIIAIISAISVGFSNIFRYLQSRKFKIPFRITYCTITEHLEVLGVNVALIGCGIVFPILFSSMPTRIQWKNLESIALAMFVVILISLLISIITAISILSKSNQKKIIMISAITIIFAIVWLVSLVIGIELVSHNFLKVIFMLIYPIIMLIYTVGYIIEKTAGEYLQLSEKITVMTVKLDDEFYLVALRHSSTEWILVPCYVSTTEYFKEKNFLYFKSDSFIIKNISGLKIQK